MVTAKSGAGCVSTVVVFHRHTQLNPLFKYQSNPLDVTSPSTNKACLPQSSSPLSILLPTLPLSPTPPFYSPWMLAIVPQTMVTTFIPLFKYPILPLPSLPFPLPLQTNPPTFSTFLNQNIFIHLIFRVQYLLFSPLNITPTLNSRPRIHSPTSLTMLFN